MEFVLTYHCLTFEEAFYVWYCRRMSKNVDNKGSVPGSDESPNTSGKNTPEEKNTAPVPMEQGASRFTSDEFPSSENTDSDNRSSTKSSVRSSGDSSSATVGRLADALQELDISDAPEGVLKSNKGGGNQQLQATADMPSTSKLENNQLSPRKKNYRRRRRAASDSVCEESSSADKSANSNFNARARGSSMPSVMFFSTEQPSGTVDDFQSTRMRKHQCSPSKHFKFSFEGGACAMETGRSPSSKERSSSRPSPKKSRLRDPIEVCEQMIRPTAYSGSDKECLVQPFDTIDFSQTDSSVRPRNLRHRRRSSKGFSPGKGKQTCSRSYGHGLTYLAGRSTSDKEVSDATDSSGECIPQKSGYSVFSNHTESAKRMYRRRKKKQPRSIEAEARCDSPVPKESRSDCDSIDQPEYSRRPNNKASQNVPNFSYSADDSPFDDSAIVSPLPYVEAKPPHPKESGYQDGRGCEELTAKSGCSRCHRANQPSSSRQNETDPPNAPPCGDPFHSVNVSPPKLRKASDAQKFYSSDSSSAAEPIGKAIEGQPALLITPPDSESEGDF